LFRQDNAYIITELSGDSKAQVVCKLNNRDDIVGRAGTIEKAETRAAIWKQSNLSGVANERTPT
jgi:hypothetical protein